MPPQAHDDRLFDLARFQIAAFFYLITHKAETGLGSLLPGAFGPLSIARKADWGNAQMKWFMNETNEWLPRVQATSADGYFKIAIKRKADDQDIWSWALEWNRNFRLVGFFGHPDLISAFWAVAPNLKMITLNNDPKMPMRIRFEEGLGNESDTLFAAVGAGATASNAPG